MTITGKIQHIALGTGFWGIVGDDGQNYRPTKLPPKLQQDGLRISAEVEDAPNQMSVFMWGKAVAIKSYEIL
jgi:hypothetical protein